MHSLLFLATDLVAQDHDRCKSDAPCSGCGESTRSMIVVQEVWVQALAAEEPVGMTVRGPPALQYSSCSVGKDDVLCTSGATHSVAVHGMAN